MYKKYIVLILLAILYATLALSHSPSQLPLVFHKEYDISFGFLDKLHPFDAQKYGKVAKHLIEHVGIDPNQFHTPDIISDSDLLKVHTQDYVDSLSYSSTIADISEVWPLRLVPNFILQSYLLTPMKYATGGTVLATQLALKHGWAINLSGGYHHAKSECGGGFCVFADIPLAIKIAHEANPNLKVLIVDLDAHQGNGHEMICGPDKRIAIFDVYNALIYPNDEEAKKYITFNHPIRRLRGIHDEEYLELLRTHLPQAIAQFQPGLIVYNAGTDVFEHDPLGGMKITAQGIVQRDELVFRFAQEKNVPVVMVLSGGYTQQSAMIIAQSVENILKNVVNQS